MASMKDLFTYPADSSEPIKYIDPTYVAGTINATQIVSGDICKIKTVGTTDYTSFGSANNNVGQSFTATGGGSGTGTVYLQKTGLLGRFTDLKDANLFTWPVTYNGSTSPQVMLEASSKFVNYFTDGVSQRELSMFDFYNKPLLQGTKSLITGSLGSANTASPIVFTITGHGFVNGEKYDATNFNSTLVALNEREWYVKRLDADTFNLSLNSGLTSLVAYNSGTSEVFAADVTTAELAKFTLSSYNVSDGALVRVNATSGTMANAENERLYFQAIDANTANLSWDSGGTDLLKFQDVDVDQTVINAVVGTGTTHININPGYPQHLSHSPIVFDTIGYLSNQQTIPRTASESRVVKISQDGNRITTAGGSSANQSRVLDYGDTSWTDSGLLTSGTAPLTCSEDGEIGLMVTSGTPAHDDHFYSMNLSSTNAVLTFRTIDDNALVDTTGTLVSSYSGLVQAAMDLDGTRAMVTFRSYSDASDNKGQVQILKRTGDAWDAEQTITGPYGDCFLGSYPQMNNAGDFITFEGNKGGTIGEGITNQFWKRTGTTWTQMPSIDDPAGLTRTYTVSSTSHKVQSQMSRDGLNFFIGGPTGTINGIFHYAFNGTTWSSPITVTTDSVYNIKTNKTGTKVWALIQPGGATTPTQVKEYNYNSVTQSWSDGSTATLSSAPAASGVYPYSMAVNSDDSLANAVCVSLSGSPYLVSLNRTSFGQIINYLNITYPSMYVKDAGGTDYYQIYDDRALQYAISIPTTLRANGTYTGTGQADIGETRANGNVTISEVSGGENIIDVASPATVTQGTLTIDGSQSHQFHIGTFAIILPGSKKYTFQNTSNVTTAGGRLDPDNFWKPNETSARTYTATGATAPTGTVTVNSDGYQTNVTLSTTGRFTDTGDILIPIVNSADTYAPRAATTAEAEEVFDTQDYWVDPAYNANKNWPTVVTPASAKITQNQPSTVNISQSGKKFVRTSGIAKWQLEVEYPPMTKEEFNQFQAVANAVQGQNIPFQFINENDQGTSIIFDTNYTNTNGDIHLELVKKAAVGDATITVGGFDQDQTKAFNKGEIVIFGQNLNSNYNVVVQDQDANKYGETKIRLAYPISVAQANGSTIYKNPGVVTVTLGSDAFDYSISTDGYYYVSVKFDLDEYK